MANDINGDGRRYDLAFPLVFNGKSASAGALIVQLKFPPQNPVVLLPISINSIIYDGAKVANELPVGIDFNGQPPCSPLAVGRSPHNLPICIYPDPKQGPGHENGLPVVTKPTRPRPVGLKVSAPDADTCRTEQGQPRPAKATTR